MLNWLIYPLQVGTLMSSYAINPPGYTEPSAAEDISFLIRVALAIQEELSNARIGLKDIDAIAGTELHHQLLQVDEKYLNILDDSRTSANKLRSIIEIFVEYALPFVRDTSNPDCYRIMAVREFANMIAHSAQENLKPYDEQLVSLKRDLQNIHTSLVEVQKRMNTVSITTSQKLVLDNVPWFTNVILLTLLHFKSLVQSSVTGSMGQTSIDSRPNSIISRNADCPTSRGAISSSESDAALKNISTIVQSLSGLIGKLGILSVIWEKIISDSSELSDYMATGNNNLDLVLMGNRVEAEVGVYTKIRHALDAYCLQT